MITLALDTAYKYLIVGIYKDGKLLDGTMEECFKSQSETIFPRIEELLKKCDLKLSDVDECVITEGPGSYTGLRIAMTIAKILGTQSKTKIYTLSTMQIYAGLEEEANVILDARAHRAYTAHLSHGKVTKEAILKLDLIPNFIQENPGTLFGDGYLIGMETPEVDFLSNIEQLRDEYHLIENVHALAPKYYKESDAYRV
ncbi:tRNA (adenosine(37)-N6)-threonylcarbamoyltransferase complex dimerization subunit type 1 TsaB [Ileibacterium valens]|uniref:tRNA (Adenosine(37)-N6)-threonylcarbamoyltransferase complex dimerization subunit type 1 TsaB n=1 Tax=Ileibacterium valens TaxID=1862668 RepID=A0A1U7NIK2_9FIRM|nr:tRNA (adenosine(37)-N6)-threonylcarbamoyltransferase complex dimerization subunit type 1 TsaB [Ileibacterium valens]OLU36670.1 tRNA (adenosine(37)-N6)-threonylcarbamoyltransferase complex dimerization subunit type 1 TsaB [Erysipelotrichaceae bacterium NYU-BL-F16]OLU40758.1 tRNA (adenosine(37)-N6)-threonylcarbamoyltransferase complex dimerization subunit type 1 TsaB [Erysipelotrichaceae bacterium NYU-BL-E8]OLU42409.1 tRNA (adenosine(37)-N6)-threonylcarbamoyltransferase complex dimerization sub